MAELPPVVTQTKSKPNGKTQRIIDLLNTEPTLSDTAICKIVNGYENAREVAKVMAALAREIHHSGRPLPRPACVVAGGETTVTVQGQGKGGRSQELALAAAPRLAGLDAVALVALGTDGTDGPRRGGRHHRGHAFGPVGAI